MILASLLLLAWLALCVWCIYRAITQPMYVIYANKDVTENKLKIGVKRAKADRFPQKAYNEREKSFDPNWRWTTESKFLRTAYLDPEAADVDEALAEALGKARSLVEQWSGPTPLEELHEQAQRMLKK